MAQKKNGPLRLLIFITLVVVGGVLIIRRSGVNLGPGGRFTTGGAKHRSAALEIKTQVDAVLDRFGVEPEWMSNQGNTLRVRLPRDLHPLQVYQQIAAAVRHAGGTITQASEDAASGVHTAVYALDRIPIETIKLIPDTTLTRRTGRIAIILDDFGYTTGSIVQRFIDLPYPITYAVIPGLPHSRELAETLHAQGKMVIIHMPMEPLNGRVETDGYTLFTALPESEIRARIRKAIADVPFAQGMNNHMGSKATSDSSVMEAALSELKKAGLFYIDSRTAPNSVAYSLAQQNGVPCLENNIFIDALDEVAHVKEKLMRLEKVAKNRGAAIGIAHPRPNTLEAFEEILPRLEMRGIKFVRVDELLPQP